MVCTDDYNGTFAYFNPTVGSLFSLRLDCLYVAFVFNVILLSHRNVVLLRCESVGNASKAHSQHYKMGKRLGISQLDLVFYMRTNENDLSVENKL